MPRLSIIIPCLSGPGEFEGTLVSVLQNRPRDCEVVVVHVEPYDDPYDLAGEVRFVRVPEQPRLVQLVNAGLEAAKAEIVHVVGCGVEVEEHWTEPALAHFVDPDVAAVSPLLVRGEDRSRSAAAGVRYRTSGLRAICAAGMKTSSARLKRAKVAGPTLRGAFYRRDVLSALCGLDERIADEHADVDLAMLLGQLEQRTVFEPASRITESLPSAAHPRSSAFVRGRSAERLFWRHAAQRGWIASLLLHPWAVLADFYREAPQIDVLLHLLGRAMALTEIGAVKRLREHVETAADKLREQHPQRTIVSLTVARAKAAHAAQDRPRATWRKAA